MTIEMSTDDNEITDKLDYPNLREVDALKERGNDFFKQGEFEKAIELFTTALSLHSEEDKLASVIHCNRSMCYAHLQNFVLSLADAKRAVTFDSTYKKAHYRLIKSLIELNRLREARQYLLVAIKDAGDAKEMKALEVELDQLYGSPLRPKPTDFDILSELGDGNFSKIYKAAFKSSPEKMYAIKVIELMTVERMQRRHRNINNEIHMEKRALNKLDHPNIVTLFATFRDYGSLYYQMEFLEGGELFEYLHEQNGGISSQVGTHFSLARFVLAEAINALEYMHRRGIVHRDVKPENMMFNAWGHLKFVDFGTAKDLVQVDLNGPEFVGTPEYMSPLAVGSKVCGPETDLWAMGAVLYQMITGSTPFNGASPYLAFLKIKRALVRVPAWVTQEVQDMLLLLLTKNATERMARATGLADGSVCANGGASINYDTLRAHPFFAYRHTDELASVDGIRNAHKRPAEKVPKLSELSIRAVGRAVLEVASATAAEGGVRPSTPWMKAFDLFKLSPQDRGSIAHYLNCRNSLHSPGVYRMFCASLVDTRCSRIDPTTREYIGFTRATQGMWTQDFFFVHITDPQFGATSGLAKRAAAVSNAAFSGGCDWTAERTRLKQAVVSINKLRPRFVVVSGNFTHAMPHESMYDSQVTEFRKTMACVSDSIPVLFVPGSSDVGNPPTMASLNAYRDRFGSDYYGFWYGGLRCLVLNSTLLQNPSSLPAEASKQDEWLAEEIEQAKLCSTHVLIFMHHPWFISNIEEENSIWTIPKEVRTKWLRRMQHHKVAFSFTGHSNCSAGGGKSFPGAVIKYKPKIKVHKSKEKMDVSLDHAAVKDEVGNEQRVVELDAAPDADSCGTPPALPDDPTTGGDGESTDLAKKSVDAEAGNDDDDDDDDDDALEEDDDENDGGYTEDERDEDGKVAFKNVQRDYEGPVVVSTHSVSLPLDAAMSGVRVVLVRETRVTHRYYPLERVPTCLDIAQKLPPCN